MLKRLTVFLLAGVMLLLTSCSTTNTANTANTVPADTATTSTDTSQVEAALLDDYNVILYEDIRDSYDSSDIVVLSQEQLLAAGEKVKDILQTAKMVYIASDMSESSIIDACGIAPTALEEESSSDTKAATAIYYENGEYYFSTVDDLSDGQGTTSDSPTEQEIYDGIESILYIMSQNS
jgi:hypothetical protein